MGKDGRREAAHPLIKNDSHSVTGFGYSSAQMHHEALRCASSFEELGKGDSDDVEACEFEARGQFPADVVEDDSATDVDGIASEADSVRFRNCNTLFRWVEGFDAND